MSLAEEMESLFDRLWPIMRSITGEGVRETLSILKEYAPINNIEVPTGTPVFDWVVPREWRFNKAYLIDPNGNRILDASLNNLHLLNYSVPFEGFVTREELDKHLFSLPQQPGAIPYVTSYYRDNWGFCLSHKQREALPEGEYRVVIDTALFDGSLTIGEAYFPGDNKEEVLFSTYVCHPSMANNELSGPVVAAFLAKYVSSLKNRKYSYRFLFLPETIGSITYLSMFGEKLKENLLAGYVLTCLGDSAPLTFKKSRQGDSLSDRVAKSAMDFIGCAYSERNFFPDKGSDERQYCSPGFNLPVSSIIRSVYGEYDEYHTSLDNKDFINFTSMSESLDVCKEIVSRLEANDTYISNNQFCEPNLGKRDLYPTLSIKGKDLYVRALFWVINYSDGEHDLIDISIKSGLSTSLLAQVAQDCLDKGLLGRRDSE